MATLHPFPAVRPVPEFAASIACVPYDVINTEEARQLAADEERSFLHVVRPEIDLAPGTDEHDDSVYAKGAENLRRYVESGDSLQEDYAALYIYRLVMDGRAQTGIYGCVSVGDYDDDTILKHEKTRLSKEDDRTRHIVEQRAHAEPVMLTFRDREGVSSIVRATMETEPLYDFTAPDGVRHTVWAVGDPGGLVDEFSRIDKLYVADGHHRCKAASRTAARLKDAPGVSDEVRYFPAVLFPMGDMHIMAYNRIIRKLPCAATEFIERLHSTMEVVDNSGAEPPEKGTAVFYLDGRWTTFRLPEPNDESVVASLDVGRLTTFVLEPLLGITDPRTDDNIDFVGGIRGTDELERLVDGGKAEMGISMYPTSVEELMQVSDAGLLMPPKSTWFEPKLRSGLLVHLF